jgi:hypothetical protein
MLSVIGSARQRENPRRSITYRASTQSNERVTAFFQK